MRQQIVELCYRIRVISLCIAKGSRQARVHRYDLVPEIDCTKVRVAAGSEILLCEGPYTSSSISGVDLLGVILKD